ncbi:hypothetical protein FRC08_006273 [Ceratobasidium sp. 394]|nr:hypothetical protein FRC08_006273 [Ceratobasidium sp. 394]
MPLNSPPYFASAGVLRTEHPDVTSGLCRLSQMLVQIDESFQLVNAVFAGTGERDSSRKTEWRDIHKSFQKVAWKARVNATEVQAHNEDFFRVVIPILGNSAVSRDDKMAELNRFIESAPPEFLATADAVKTIQSIESRIENTISAYINDVNNKLNELEEMRREKQRAEEDTLGKQGLGFLFHRLGLGAQVRRRTIPDESALTSSTNFAPVESQAVIISQTPDAQMIAPTPARGVEPPLAIKAPPAAQQPEAGHRVAPPSVTQNSAVDSLPPSTHTKHSLPLRTRRLIGTWSLKVTRTRQETASQKAEEMKEALRSVVQPQVWGTLPGIWSQIARDAGHIKNMMDVSPVGPMLDFSLVSQKYNDINSALRYCATNVNHTH